MNPLIDRSAQEYERQKKRSRLQEMLTDHLVHRPGPLDLLSANILKVDPDQQDSSNDGMYVNCYYMTCKEVIFTVCCAVEHVITVAN